LKDMERAVGLVGGFHVTGAGAPGTGAQSWRFWGTLWEASGAPLLQNSRQRLRSPGEDAPGASVSRASPGTPGVAP